MLRQWHFFVSVLASKPRGTLYIGVTNNLHKRVQERQEGRGGAFMKKYHVHKLVWFEEFSDIKVAIQREKSLKRWSRKTENQLDRTHQSALGRSVARRGKWLDRPVTFYSWSPRPDRS